MEELKPLATVPSHVIRKHRFSFYETRLDMVLRMLGRDALLVSGVTAMLIETTIREVYLRDYDIVAITDSIGAETLAGRRRRPRCGPSTSRRLRPRKR